MRFVFSQFCWIRSSYQLIWGEGRGGRVEGRESRWRPTRIPQLTGSRKRCAHLATLHWSNSIWPAAHLSRCSTIASHWKRRGQRPGWGQMLLPPCHQHWYNTISLSEDIWIAQNAIERQRVVLETCDSLVTIGKKVSSLPPIWSHSVPLVICSPSKQELQSRAAVNEALRGEALVRDKEAENVHGSQLMS